MRRYVQEQQLCFDDILLVPQFGTVQSRGDVDLSMKIGVGHRPLANINLQLPIIASPMDTVCDTAMALTLSEVGGLGVLHRYMDRNLVVDKTYHLHEKGARFGVSLSTKEVKDSSYVLDLLKAGARIFCIDTANGHSSHTVDAVKNLRKIVPDDCHIMSGNVAIRSGFYDLIEAGADSVRVGIGGGSACTTRVVSGHGLPTLASIMDCFRDSDGDQNSIIADGGIRNTGDMVKAFAAGASAVMLGNLLAGHDESPKKLSDDGKLVFRGMASAEAQEDWSGGYRSVEGVSGSVPERGSVVDTLSRMRYGIASGCSYSGVKNLNQINQKARYVTVSNLTSKESSPRI